MIENVGKLFFPETPFCTSRNMKKLTLVTILAFFFSIDYSQQTILVLKKKNKMVKNFWTGSTFLGGVVLKKTYKLTFRLGKKYHLETVSFQATPNGSD